MSCIDCAVKNCDKMDKTYPEFCLTTNMDQDVYKDAMDCYKEEENHNIMVAAAEVECDHYCQYTRVEEIMAFAERIGEEDRHRYLRGALEGEPDSGGDLPQARLYSIRDYL